MRRALLIGVRRYDGGYSQSIARAVAGDLDAMRTLCAGRLGYSIESVLGLGDEGVRKRDIEDAVGALFAVADEDDELLVYFSGHGRRAGGVDLLVPTDARVDHPLGRPFDDLVVVDFDDLRARSRARSAFVVIDACRDGSDPPDAADRPAPRPPAGNRPLGFLFGTSAGTKARTTKGMSVFTHALTSLVPTFDAGVRLRDAERRLQEEVTRLCAAEGLPEQLIEVAGNVAGLGAPFPLFEVGGSANARDVWSRAVGASPALAFPRDLLEFIDDLEHDAPDPPTESAAVWATAPLPERLARAVVNVAGFAAVGEHERSLLLGLVAAVEAGFRRGEASLLPAAPTAAVHAVLAAAPRLRELLEGRSDRDDPLWSWVCHLAAPTTCVGHDSERLRADLARVSRVVFESEDTASTAAADYLLQCVRVAFHGPSSAQELEVEESFGVDRPFTLFGRRMAALLELVWWYAIDTRLFTPEFGQQLLSETTAPAEALTTLGSARWHDRGRVLQLDLACPSAVLDHELRRVCSELSTRLLRETQPGRPFADTESMPVAAVPARLRPRRGAGGYRLPHVAFTVSTADMHGLLMGSNFYGDEMLAVREAYQNAEDACRYRARHDGQRGLPPEIAFEISSVDDGLILDCLDNGVGMSDHELRSAFARVGGRFRDLPEFLEEEQRDRRANVEPFYPISQFGIGVLSYFMIADRVELWTRRTRPDGGYHEALHVDIASGGDLLMVRQAQPPEVPSGSGTRLRFHLHEHIGPERVLAALVATVRAPRVRVRLEDRTGMVADRTWEPTVLYQTDGDVRDPCFPLPDLGVYLHPGYGSVLVNGIAVPDSGPQLYGHTLSLDGRCRPELSVDRRTLRTYDEERASDLVCQAAARSADWTDVTANWLYELLQGHPKAGRKAYAALRAKLLPLRMRPGDEHDVDARKLLNVRPEIDGILLEDPSILAGSPPMTVIARTRASELEDGLSSGRGLRPRVSVPAFDDRLAVLQAGSARTLAVSELVDLADVLGVGLGAALVYAWAVQSLDNAVSVTFRSAAADLDAEQSAALREAAGAGSFRVMHSGATPTSIDLEEVSGLPLLSTVVPGLPDIDPAAALELSPAALRLWSRDEDGRNPFFARWEDVTKAGRRTDVDDAAVAELASVFRVTPTAGSWTPGEPSPESSETFPIGEERADWSADVRRLVARDRDDRYPFYVERVPAVHLAVLAAAGTLEAAELAALVRAAGLVVVPDVSEPEDWDALTELFQERLDLGDVLNMEDDGRLELPTGFDGLAVVDRRIGLAAAKELALRLMSVGFAGPRLQALTATEVDVGQMRRVTRALSSSKDIDDALLVAVAELLPGGYEEAWELLRRLEPVAGRWKLADSRPDELSGFPTEMETAFASWSYTGVGASQRVMTVFRMAVLGETTMAETRDDVRRLFAAGGADTGLLDAVAGELSAPLIFDDLLVLATQQFDPPVDSAARIEALCRPFAHRPSEIRDRAARFLRIRPLWGRVDLSVDA